MKIQILTSKDSWLNRNKRKTVVNYLKKFSKKISLINNHKNIKKNLDICIILSYYKIIPSKFLKYSKFNLVVHESNLPSGKGFSPLYWQILNGKKKIVFTLFEASQKMDAGDYYYKKSFSFKKNLFYNDIKIEQLKCALNMVSSFLKKYRSNKKIKLYKQKGKSTYFRRRNAKDSMLNINKSLMSQINLIRICDNQRFPAYFKYRNKKFIINMKKD